MHANRKDLGTEHLSEENDYSAVALRNQCVADNLEAVGRHKKLVLHKYMLRLCLDSMILSRGLFVYAQSHAHYCLQT